MSDLPTNADIKPVEVYALPTGQLTHPDRWLFEDGAEDLMKERNEYPVFSFLIKHHSGKHVLFDLGLAKVRKNVTHFHRRQLPLLSIV